MAEEAAAAPGPADGPAMTDGPGEVETLGPNAWLVDDMFERYRADPSSVGESWRDFFEGYRGASPLPGNGAAT
ncbi:MAG TPA: hypothetical protein VE760_00995, partial [Acidimicrobiales bacterium]|nr:hypothetical protein [Acidimicrobiales bacterium]